MFINNVYKVRTKLQSTNNIYTNCNYYYGEFITYQLQKYYKVYTHDIEFKTQNKRKIQRKQGVALIGGQYNNICNFVNNKLS